MSQKLLTVFGATGTQGGSVIRAVLNHPKLSKEFKIRAITRDTTKPAAQELTKQGVEVVSADITSKSSVLSALKDTHTLFLVTLPNFADPHSDVELVTGKLATDAAKEAGVQHLIFSSLINVSEVSKGKLVNVLHFDRKAEVEAHIKAAGLPSTSFVLPGYFMSNYIAMGMIRKGDDGVWTLAYPVGEQAQFPLFDAEADTGKFVTAAISSPGSRLLAAADYYSPSRIIDEFKEVTGHKAQFFQISSETYKSFLPASFAQEMLENHLLTEGPGYFGGESLEESKKVLEAAGEKATTWKQFLEKNKQVFA